MTVETLGIDIAKNVFQLHGVNHHGCVVLKRRVMRDQLLDIVAQVERCTIVVEACTGAFCWARKFETQGHQVKIISPQYVKPFVRRHKNDGNDAEAICTAARQPHIPLVPKKTVEQQDIQALHRSRQRMVNHRTAVVSQIRGLLLDRGFAIAKSITRARRLVPEILSDLENELTPLAREAIAELHDLFRDLDRRIAIFDKKIDAVFRGSERCQRIATIKGVGPKTATAIVAAIGDGSEFKNGRHLAAWIGLVPRQFSSGDRTTLMGISNICAACSFTAPELWSGRRHPRQTSITNGSISFGSGAASTVPRWQSPTRMHGSSGLCFKPANRTAPLSEDLPGDCETTEK
jgi:transposase